jgi:hypothetical protein
VQATVGIVCREPQAGHAGVAGRDFAAHGDDG